MINEKYIKKMKPEEQEKMLIEIVSHLNELDGDDTFGTEGWAYAWGFEE
jgi:hypothetical protein